MQEEREVLDNKEQAPVNLPFQMNAWSALNKGQKIAIVSLAVFVLFLMIAWIYQFKKSLTDPFTYKGPVEDQAAVVDPAVIEQDALKKKDTDGDGLSDWDELNVYKTSPYLEDTDGDGIKDGEEVKNSTDPNCPEGKSCVKSTVIENIQPPVAAPTTVNLDIKNNASSTGSAGELNKILQGGADAATIRKMLIDSGMDAKTLDQLTDQQLLESYNNTINSKASSNVQ